MKTLRRCLPIAIACLSAFSVARADFEADVTTQLAKTIKYVNQHSADIWPDLTLTDMPTIVYFPNGSDHMYAYHYVPGRQDWKLLNIENLPVYFRDKNDIDDNLKYYGINIGLFDKKPAVIFNPTNWFGGTALDNVAEMVAWRFDTLQYHSHISEADWQMYLDSTYDSFNQLENIKLAYLGVDAMKDYLQTNNLDALKDYMAVEQHRLDISNKQSKSYEWARQIITGPRSYVGDKALNLSDKDYAQKVLSNSGYQQICNSIASPHDIAACMLWVRDEFNNAAIGYALDKVGKEGWKKQIAYQAFPTIGTELAMSLPMDSSEMVQRLNDAKTRYHYDQISMKVDSVMKPYLAEMAELREKDSKTPGVDLKFNDVCFGLRAIGFGEYLISDRLFMTKNYSYTDTCKNSDKTAKDVVTLTNVPVHYQSYWDSFGTSFAHQFKISSDTSLIIDGKKQTAGEFVATHEVKEFKSLVIKNSEVDIEVNEKGVIDGSNDKIVFNAWTIGGSDVIPTPPKVKKDKKEIAIEKYTKLQEMVKKMVHKG